MSSLASRRDRARNTLGKACRSAFGTDAGFQHVCAPGRVNLLGDHTDYNGGFVLPMTLDRAVYVAVRKRDDDRVRLYCANRGEGFDYPLGDIPAQSPGSWGSYVAGVIRDFHALTGIGHGIELAFYGDVPVGAGLSSSAALTVACAMGLDRLFETGVSGGVIARLCQEVERTYAGVRCGIMDQYVSALGRAGHALFLDCRELVHRDIALKLDNYTILVVHSGVSRGLSDSQYNDRRAQCEEGVAVIAATHPGIASLRDVPLPLLQERRGGLDDVVYRRCRHVVEENARVLRGAAALEAGDMAAFGGLMYQSHDSLARLYEVSCRELDCLVALCQAVGGVAGARMTGAGFGGCVVALVAADAIESLEAEILGGYSAQCGLEPRFYRLVNNMQSGPLP